MNLRSGATLYANASTESAAEARNRIVASTTDMINEKYFKNEKISASQYAPITKRRRGSL